MSSTPYFPLYVADYLADTSHLTTEQHGAYMLLLLAAWPRGGRLPADMRKLARIARVSPRRWHLVSEDVLEFFEIDGEEIVNRRLEREHKKATSKSAKRSAAGKRGGIAKALKDKERGLANATANACHFPEPEPEDTKVSNLLSDLPEENDPKPTPKPRVEKRFGVKVDHPVWEAWNAWPKQGRARSSIKDTLAAYDRMDIDHAELMAAIAAYLRTPDGKENPKGLHRWINDQRFMPFLEAASVTAMPVEPVELGSSPEDVFLAECREDRVSEIQIRRFRGRFHIEQFGPVAACVTDESDFHSQLRETLERLDLSVYGRAYAAKRRSA